MTALRSAGGVSLFAVERENVQKRTFTRWMNLHLEKVSPALGPGSWRARPSPRVRLSGTGGGRPAPGSLLARLHSLVRAFSQPPGACVLGAGRQLGAGDTEVSEGGTVTSSWGCPCRWGS